MSGLWKLSEIEDYDHTVSPMLFNYIVKLSFNNLDDRWWDDEIGVDFDCANDAMAFASDFMAENEGKRLEIEFWLDVINISLKTDTDYYGITEDMENDAHANIFHMILWIIAKSLGWGEEL